MKTTTKKRILQFVLLVGTVISLYFVPWRLVKAWILPLPQTVQQQLNDAVEQGFDGVVVYIDQAGIPPQSFASGWHDRDSKTPAKTNALFKIASINKLYDAVAITKLVSDGRLSLDNTLADYFPELVGRIEHAKQITLRMMIQHRSGIPNFTDTDNFWAKPTDSSAEDYTDNLSLILDKPASFAPGKDYEYSNTNYLLLNQIMDKVLGYQNFQFIQQRILAPLALKNTFSSIKDVDLNDVMSGYHVGHPYDLKTEDRGMVATAEDVGIFIRALNDGSVFEGNEREIYSGLYEYEHTGWVPGYQSFATYHQEQDTVVIQFYSTTDSELLNWNLSQIINSRIVKIFNKQYGAN
ncbi:class A beta-lactamase-related serine hydrolase [Thalassotalea sp. HSM 43]|uniref:serine hydrolase domain-containing protein n=1 Tax=Thalassotalea sp. HSM 43 TaxID=2552945 RepID=UPI00108060FE|nr:serine hydrolase domain-containing protein [Thalassotalea sp. HSM 43]QBY05995.1 class A beta-lactamase-related serine hydrolase [Thalassotalea sp. HSM 43]